MSKEQIAARTLPGGEYELWLTEAGNPANVLLASATITLAAGATSTFVVVPETGSGTTRLSVLMLQGGSAVIYDRNVTRELRIINAATDTVPRDVAINGVFSPPLFSAAPFARADRLCAGRARHSNAQCHARRQPRRARARNANRANPRATNDGDVHGTGGYAAVCGHRRRRSPYSGRGETELHERGDAIPRRRLRAHADGGDPANIPARNGARRPGSQFAYSLFPPGTYDLYLRETTTGALLSGPTRFTVDGGGIYSVLATNGPDTATAIATLYDDFP